MKNGSLVWRNEKIIWRIGRQCEETKKISYEIKKNVKENENVMEQKKMSWEMKENENVMETKKMS